LEEKYKRLQTIYEEDRAFIGLYFSSTTLVQGKGLSVSAISNWFNIFYDIENWHRKN